MGLIKIIVLVSIIIMMSLSTPGFVQDGLARERFFEVKAKKFSYTPSLIKVNKGDLVRIRLISEDVHHGMFMDGYDVSTSAHPGQDGSLTFVAAHKGRFSFRCSVTCGEFHPYMVGYLIVEPNNRFRLFTGLILLLGLAQMLFLSFRKGPEVKT